MAEIEVKCQRSCEILQSLKSDLNAHGSVIIIRRKLIFGRMTEVHKGINIPDSRFQITPPSVTSSLRTLSQTSLGVSLDLFEHV